MSTRSLESFNEHLEKKVANCCKAWLVLSSQSLLGEQYHIIPQRCKSNFCESCRKDNLRKLRKSLYESMKRDRWRLCTLTFPDHTKDLEVALHDSYTMFKRLTRQLRKIRSELKYIRTLEVHKSGFIHIHCVFNQYIPVSYIQSSWKELGGGIVDVTASRRCPICFRPTPCKHNSVKKKLGYRDAAHYLTEEIEKQAQDPHTLGYILWKNRIRTVATSRNVKLRSANQVYNFVGRYSSLTEAYHLYERLETEACNGSGPQPSMSLSRDSVTFGYGRHYTNIKNTRDLFSLPTVYTTLKRIDEIRQSPVFNCSSHCIDEKPF